MAGGTISETVTDGINRQEVLVALGFAACVILAETATTWVVFALTSSSVSMVGLVVIALTVVGGLQARWGVSLGVLLAGTLFGSVTAGATATVSAFVATTVCARLWNPPDRRRPRWIAHYVGVAVLTVLALAATTGTFAEFLDRAPFSVAVAATVRAALPVAIVGFPAVWSLADRVEIPEHGAPTSASTRQRRLTAAIVSLWAVAGYAASFAFQALALIPSIELRRRLSPVVQTAFELFDGGRYALLLLGVVALIALGYVRHEK